MDEHEKRGSAGYGGREDRKLRTKTGRRRVERDRDHDLVRRLRDGIRDWEELDE